MLSATLEKLLDKVSYVDIATCDFDGRPNTAPKFLLKLESNYIYLVDYTLGRTYQNLIVNPRVSLPVMDIETLVGYQVNGSARIIDKGKEYKELFKELENKTIKFSVQRIIAGVRKEKHHNNFEVMFTKHFVIIKIKVDEIVEIGPTGTLKRSKIKIKNG